MTTTVFPILLFIGEIVCIFFISRVCINEMFFLFYALFKNEHLVFSLVTLIFFPGTIIHELSHFIFATALGHRIHSVTVFPQRKGNYIKLGSVLYEKKDIVRSVLVGIAPIFFGLFILWFISEFHLFPQTNLFINLVILYFIFTISSTMFSSKQDLIDIIFIIPIFVVLVGVIYIFNIKLDFFYYVAHISKGTVVILDNLNGFLFLSLMLNLILIGVFKGLRFLIKK